MKHHADGTAGDRRNQRSGSASAEDRRALGWRGPFRRPPPLAIVNGPNLVVAFTLHGRLTRQRLVDSTRNLLYLSSMVVSPARHAIAAVGAACRFVSERPDLQIPRSPACSELPRLAAFRNATMSAANNPRTNARTTRSVSGQDATATSATAAASTMTVRTTLPRRIVVAGDRRASRRTSSARVPCKARLRSGNAILFGASNCRMMRFLEFTR
jgi:hypothetical protein